MDLRTVLHTIVNQTRFDADAAENAWLSLEAHHAVDAAADYLNAPGGAVPSRPVDTSVPTIDVAAVQGLVQQLNQATAALEAIKAASDASAAAQPAAPAATTTVPQFAPDAAPAAAPEGEGA